MQKLQKELKNIPRDASLVPCSINSSLNKVQRPSDLDKVLICNNSEENHQQHKAGSDCTRVLNTVYVLNKKGNALMPTCQSKARRLLKSNKVKVVKRYPFTIQFITDSGYNKQEIILGVDIGYKYVGLSAKSNKKELFAAEMILRTNISELLSERRMYRRNRRGRHHWYRKPRFDNRRIDKGWLPPSIQHKT
jgi:hypothetical protein